MSRAILASLALAGPALAQATTVCVTGRVEPVGGPTICMQGETHRLDCTGVFLRSNSIDLNQYNGQVVTVSGADVGVTCHVIQVNQVQPPQALLEWCGSASTCCSVKFKVCPGGLGQWWLFLSGSPGYAPLGCGWPIEGTVLIGLPFFQIAGGTIGASCGETTVGIPCDNSLVGVQVWLQGARRDIGPVGPLHLTNPVCFTIAPFLPPCAPTNC